MDRRLEIRTLGSPEILLNGEPVKLNTQKTEALLIYIACEGRHIARSELAEKFWENSTEEQARTNLRVALNNLRKYLSTFVSTLDPLFINSTSNYWLDAQEFETQVNALTSNLNVQTAPQLEQVLELYCGEFLQSFFIDSNYFEDWVRDKRQDYHRLMQTALNELVTYYSLTKDYNAGIRWATRSLQMDELQDDIHCQLMFLLAVTGQRHAALNQFETYKTLLESFKATPSQAILKLYEQIKSGEFGSSQSPLNQLSEVIPGALVFSEDDLLGRSRVPEKLIGRDEIHAEINTLLKEKKRLLIRGFPGVGKTALAATIVADYINAGKVPIIWLQVGAEPARAVLDTLAFRLGNGSNTEATQIVHLLQKKKVKLIVLDDAWDGSALDQVMKVIPTSIPIIVTSRNRFPVLHNVAVSMLPRQFALELLSHHAKKNWEHSTDANQICQLLGDLPFAIRIAGEMLALDDLHPSELLSEISASPHMIQMPSGFEESQKNLAALLQVSLQRLNDQDRATFMAFGRLFARGATSTLLALVMQQNEQTVKQSLRMVQQRGLADRENREDSQLTYYSIHDLAFSYVKSEQTAETQLTQEACLQFARNHKANVQMLHAEQGNILGAAQSAYHTKNAPLLIELMCLLTTDSQYLSTYGHTIYLTERTDEAIAAAREMGVQKLESLHYLLSKRGNMYYERGDLREALDCYQEAGELAHQLNWSKRYMLAMCVTSKVRSEMGDVAGAQTGLEEAYRLAEETQDYEMLARVLENWAVHAYNQHDYEKTRELSRKGFELGKQNNDTRIQFNALFNWADAEQQMGNFEESLSLLKQALEIAQAEKNIRWRAYTLKLQAVAYYHLDNCDEALRLLGIALELFRQGGITTAVTEVEDLIRKISEDCNSRSKKD